MSALVILEAKVLKRNVKMFFLGEEMITKCGEGNMEVQRKSHKRESLISCSRSNRANEDIFNIRHDFMAQEGSNRWSASGLEFRLPGIPASCRPSSTAVWPMCESVLLGFHEYKRISVDDTKIIYYAYPCPHFRHSQA